MELSILYMFDGKAHAGNKMLTIGLQAMYIGCNDTSVIVINFRKSKTHAITDTYCRCGVHLHLLTNIVTSFAHALTHTD